MENKPKPPSFSSLSFDKQFFMKLNKKIVRCSNNSITIASKIIEALLGKDKKTVLSLAENGLPDDLPMLRAYIWKIMLNYLPVDTEKWESILKKKRSEYDSYKKLIEVKLAKEYNDKNYKSRDTLEQIIKDVYRTGTQYSFFFHPTNNKKILDKEEAIKMFERRKNCTFKEIDEIYYNEKENETHADVLKRILFIYTIFCADISYHQGMNELLAPIYYCYSYDHTYTDETEENIEADAFWSFHYLMSKVSLSFVSANDLGLQIKSFIYEKCLAFVDEELYNHLKNLGVKNEYYCYRWFILLFSQEFEINDVLKLWDLIFSQEDIYYYVVYIGMALMINKKEIFMKQGMVEIMQELQNFENVDVGKLIQKAKELKNENSEDLDEFILKTKQIPAGE